MNKKLNDAITSIMNKGETLSEPCAKYEFSEGPNRDRCAVISNRRTHKAGIIHYSEQLDNITYHLLSFRKINWLEAEGWTTGEILGKMGKQVLKAIDREQFPYALSIEGD